MLEKDDLTDVELHHQEGLPKDSLKTRHESWPVKFLSSAERYDFSEIYPNNVNCQLQQYIVFLEDISTNTYPIDVKKLTKTPLN